MENIKTERLREIVEHRSPSLRWGEAEKIAAELLANREAQAVAAGKFAGWGLYHAGRDDFDSWLKHRPEDDSGDAITKHGYVNVKLFASPPAPVVNPEFTGATAVPEEMKRDPDADVFDPGFMNGWNACRAAMLAQPVSQGYKLVPVEVLATASTLIDLCRTHTILQDTGSYKERTINDCENTMEVIDGLLAAAPEGGNGK